MAFVSWTQLYEEAKTALANRSWDLFFLQRVQNKQDMETAYTKLGNITDFIDWLEMKAAAESEGDGAALQFCIGGN